MALPIIIIHLNDSGYLLYALAQAKKYNPQSDIILLGNDRNNRYKFVAHENVYDYSQEALEFAKVYKHFNTNLLEFERLCFQRWFVLKNFLETYNIEKCLCIDSDVMLFVDVTEEQKKIADFDFTLSLGQSPHCMFINSRAALENFCDFVFNIYTDSSLLQIMESRFQQCTRNNIGGGASDMTAFKEFWNRKGANIYEMSTIRENSKYDHNINMSEGFQVYGGIKNIYLIEEEPFCNCINTEQKIRFNSIHFQGDAKKYMQDYYSGEIFIKEGRKWQIQKYKPVHQEKYDTERVSDSSAFESEDLDKNYVVLPFQLKANNFIVFPDWSQPEETISLDLEQVIKAIATRPNSNQIALLIDSSNIPDEDAVFVLSSVTMNLLMQDDLDVSAGPEIILVGQLSEMQWEALLLRTQARIVLENENQEAIAKVNAENVPLYHLNEKQIS